MPETFCSQWEYYQCDPEIEEIIRESGRGIVGDEFGRGDHGYGNPGFILDPTCRQRTRNHTRHVKQVVFSYLYCVTGFTLDEMAVQLKVERRTLVNWRSSMGLKGRNKPTRRKSNGS